MWKLKLIIRKYNSQAEVFDHETMYVCSNFPEELEQPIIDYIDCNYEIVSRDPFGVTFEEKQTK